MILNIILFFQEIAAHPRYLTDVDYLGLLIHSEESEMQPGWQERVQHLKTQKEMAEQMAKVKDPNFDPFAQYGKEMSTGQYIMKYLQKFKFWK